MKRLLNFLGTQVLPSVINLYIKTLRIKIHNLPDLNLSFIFLFWHSKMLIGWWLFRNRNSVALVSQSKDGDILNNVLVKWNYIVIRGSSSKGGKEAISKIISNIRKSNSVIITPDGPRGPTNILKNGPLIISNKCNVPIIPVKIKFYRKKILNKSWDRFEIPLPFSKCDVYFGNKYFYDVYLDNKELEEYKSRLSKEM